MANSNRIMIHKLQTAINQNFGERLLIDKSQFYSEQQKRPVTTYKVCLAIPVGQKRHKKKELFNSTSMIQIVLYLRDYWYWLNNWEIPTDNEQWNNIKQLKNIKFETANNIIGISTITAQTITTGKDGSNGTETEKET